MKKSTLALLCLLFAAFPAAAPADEAKAPAQGLLWKASSATAAVYLLGSLHATPPSFYPLPRHIEEAFGDSDALVVEVNVNKLDQQKVFAFIGEKGVYPDGRTLPECIGGKTWEETTNAFARLGIPQTGIEKLKPWYVAMMLMMAQVEKLGFDPKLGIDAHFLDLAARKKMRVDELESAVFQMNLFAHGDAAEQEQLLAMTLTEIEGMNVEMAALARDWLAGDAKALAELLEKKLEADPASRAIVNRLIYDRNDAMADRVERYLKGTGTTFVVVGSAHLVGDRGIVKRLGDHQFRLQQIGAAASPAR